MINCPTCGQPVAENQRFCGNCGTDVQAASGFHGPTPGGTGGTAGPAAQGAAYGYDTGAYDYQSAAPQRPATMIWLIVAGVAVLCLCCGLAAGGFFGLAIGPGPIILFGAPSVTPTPTPEGLNLFFRLFNV